MNSDEPRLPVGKLPAQMMQRLLERAPLDDPGVLVGPGVGFDCAIVDAGAELIAAKSDPITFASKELGYYLVEVNCNDIATVGATPRWLLLTVLLPENDSTESQVSALLDDVYAACRRRGIAVVGGHTEVTHGLQRPIAVGTLLGALPREQLIGPQGVQVGDAILLTKSVPIEATCLLAREFSTHLASKLSGAELRRAQAFLYEPGISVLRDAQVAMAAGKVTAMHDPTEGGLIAALMELSKASAKTFHVDLSKAPVDPVSKQLCELFAIDAFKSIASGALLLTVASSDAPVICEALAGEHIVCTRIGTVAGDGFGVYDTSANVDVALTWPERDEIARVFASG